MAPHKVDAYFNLLGKTPEYTYLFKSAQKLREDQSAFFKLIPAQLTQHCSLGLIKDSRLTILAGNGAIAAKLKQLSPSLLLKLQKLDWKITAIHITVQADSIPGNSKSSRNQKYESTKLKLSQTGKASLNQLAATLADSELKDTIHSFIRKHSDE
ncbi:MAG: DUF721 domain-containing protein [Betaproteobacteria bacterium]|nr:DUF721 domain-containing protein [Betaproteobacteria bacterium]